MTGHTRQHVRGVIALGTITLLLTGIPGLLLAWGADPRDLLPGTWPRLADIRHWPAQAWAALRWGWLDGSLPAHLLLALAWSSWLALVAMILTEMARQLRHGLHPLRIPTHRWVAGLVASAILVCTAGTASALPATGTQVVATAPHRPPHPATPPDRAWADPAPRPDCPRVIVRAGDTLWDLAAHHLGDGRRYREIEALNTGRIPRAAELHPGDLLLLPPDATHLLTPPEPGLGTRVIRVAPRDTLSGIAARELGDPHAWRVLLDLNHGHRQPDGHVLHDPDRLRPGWLLTMPAQQSAAEPEPAPPSSPPPVVSAPPPAPPQASASPSPAAAPPSGSLATGDAAAGFDLPTGAYVGLGLAALITSAAVTVRLRRRRYYRPSITPGEDSTNAPVVRALRIAHDTTTDQDSTPAAARALPDLETRDRADTSVRDAQPAAGLAVLGVRDGHAVARDLARGHGLGLVGAGAHAAARALLVTLLADTATATVVVMPAADARTLLGALPQNLPARLRLVADLPDALDLCETSLREPDPARRRRLVLVATPRQENDRRLHDLLDHATTPGVAGILLGHWPAGGTAHVRADGTFTDGNPANLAGQLAGTRLFTLPATDTTDLLTLLHDAHTNPPAQHDRTNPSSCIGTEADGYEFTAPATGTSNASANPSAFTAAATDVGQLLPVNTTATPGETSSEDSVAESSAEMNEPSPADTPPLRLDVLGRLRLVHTAAGEADLVGGFAPRQREILLYLALHPGGVRRATLTAALWPDAPGDRPYNSFHATLSQLRRVLRTATHDTIASLTLTEDSHYRLDPNVVDVDLWRLTDALAHARSHHDSAARTAALREALDCYRGDFADGLTAQWAEAPREHVRRAVLDACAELVHHVRPGNPADALALLERARAIDPCNEAIYRDLMRTQALLGRHDAIPRTLALLTTVLADLDEQPDPSTITLANTLTERAHNKSHQPAHAS